MKTVVAMLVFSVNLFGMTDGAARTKAIAIWGASANIGKTKNAASDKWTYLVGCLVPNPDGTALFVSASGASWDKAFAAADAKPFQCSAYATWGVTLQP